MAKGGIIMDVTTAEEARVAENAGVCCIVHHSHNYFKNVSSSSQK